MCYIFDTCWDQFLTVPMYFGKRRELKWPTIAMWGKLAFGPLFTSLVSNGSSGMGFGTFGV